jgi:hypothetical protein
MTRGVIGIALWLVAEALSVDAFHYYGLSAVNLLAKTKVRNANAKYTRAEGSSLLSLRMRQLEEHGALTESLTPSASTTKGTLAKGIAGNASDQASIWRAQAERIREDAEKLDSELTLQKIEAIERKLNNKVWLVKNPDQIVAMQSQLEILQTKLAGRKQSPDTNGAVDNNQATNSWNNAPSGTSVNETIFPVETNAVSFSSRPSAVATKGEKNRAAQKAYIEEEDPLSGYDQADLDLYMPVITAIEENLPSNATLQEKIEAFQAAPELQEHFQGKINKLLVDPMKDLLRMQQLRLEYLESSSSVERTNIKREIGRLEKATEDEGAIIYSDSIVYDRLPVLEEEEIQQRLQAVGALHPILQALYKKRCGVDEDAEGSLRLAIEMAHYEPQLQLLEQIRNLDEPTDEVEHEARLAILSLPLSVRNQFAQNLGLELHNGETNADVAAMINALIDDEGDRWMNLQHILSDETTVSLDLTGSNDLDYIDRSRYVKEFLPALTRLELVHPPLEEIETLIDKVVDKKVFMVTSKPERVMGGYYIPGRNLLSDSEETNSDQMVSILQERLQKSPLKDKIDLFYIEDPSPPTDEEYEMGDIVRPVLVAVAKNRDELYSPAEPLMKLTVSLLGVFSILLFSAATTGMQPFMQGQIAAAASGENIDLEPILRSASEVAASILAIQASHEIAHRIVAWRDKVSTFVVRLLVRRFSTVLLTCLFSSILVHRPWYHRFRLGFRVL